MNVLLVGRDPTDTTGAGGDLLDRCLGQAGLQRGKDVSITCLTTHTPPGNVFARHAPTDISRGISALHDTIERERPNVVVCLGNEAAHACISDWPSTNGAVSGAYGIQERRGYWEQWSDGGPAIVATLRPADLVRSGGRGTGAIDEMLLTYDLERAKEVALKGLQRPVREVRIVSSMNQAAAAIPVIRNAKWVACDIENSANALACVGFAVSSSLAYVFTPPAFVAAFALLRDPLIKKCFHNGQYDMYFLRSRCGVDVEGFTDDTIVAFHVCWPALAGKGERGSKRTQKSLRFLASIYTFDRWWKDYDFAHEAERFELNGRDCMVTWDVHQRLVRERRMLGISPAIYQHELSLVWPCIKVLERGIRVDSQKLELNRAQLSNVVAKLAASIEATAKPLLEEAREHISRPALFWTRTACKCCHSGKGKRAECWACAGFASKPSKKVLGDKTLGPCKVCAGAGSSESFAFNFDSSDQKKILLYEVLGITPRYDGGKVCASEDKLKEILGSL